MGRRRRERARRRQAAQEAREAARDADLAARWERVRCTAPGGMPTSTAGTHPAVLVVTWVRQAASTGLKGYADFMGGPGHAVWFRGWHPPVGAILLVGGRYWPVGRGQHHGEPVFWVDGVWEVLPPDAPLAWARHRARIDAAMARAG